MQISEFESHQLEVIARVTPHAMAGHILNTTVLAIALAGSMPTSELIAWCVCSYGIALLVLYRHLKNRGRRPRSFPRAARRATAYAFLLALPWTIIVVLHLGSMRHDEEIILVALVVGMAASGSILLSAVPAAAFGYMSAILVPSALVCLVYSNRRDYLLLGVLAVSYWWFLAALIAKIKGEISERQQADVALKESEVRLQEALTAGQVVAFTWDPATRTSQRSENAAQMLGFGAQRPKVGRKQFLAQLHPEDRSSFAAQMKQLCPKRPSYSASFRFIREDGREVWLEETGKAEFDVKGKFLRLRGLTRDITERKRAEERQRLLIRELDHRVKNVLASVSTVAQRTREGSGSIDEFLQVFEGRIQAMANAHALLSRGQWYGVSLADLVNNELAPCVGDGNAIVQGPEVLLSPEAAQPMAIVLHELVTNASKYGALTTPQGKITVRWGWQSEARAQERLSLNWIETGGPPVLAPNQPGYGTSAIRNLIPYELGGTVDLLFDAAGLRCDIELPSRCVRKDGQGTIRFSERDPVQSPAEGLSAASLE